MPLTGDAKREYQRNWVARRRSEFFSDKSCVKCGSTEDLQLDHIDPNEKISHKIWSWSAIRREAEIAKCQILCGPHHAEKTLVDIENRLGKPLYQHGTHGMYVRHKCRCSLCKAAHAVTNSKYR